MAQTVIMAAGGTGGHIVPALTVADALRAKGYEIHWIGTARGLEVDLVAPHYLMTYLPMTSLRGRRWWGRGFALWRLCRSVWAMRSVLKKHRPVLVIGMGGYVAAPVGLAAWLCRVPLIIHEQNAHPGMANRVLSRVARVVLQAFPHSFPAKTRAKVVGNPVRGDFVSDIPHTAVPSTSPESGLRVLVTGGSQGAESVNTVVLDAWSQLSDLSRIEVWHLTGAADEWRCRERYNALGIKATVMPFHHHIAEAYRWANLVVSRAGAMTVTEIAMMGVASILIPYPYAVDQHQRANAAFLEKEGAALLYDQSALTSSELASVFQQYIEDPELLSSMGQAARRASCPQALDDIMAVCDDVICGKERPCYD